MNTLEKLGAFNVWANTTVLNRLVEYGEAESSLDGHSRRTWRWIAEERNQSAG